MSIRVFISHSTWPKAGLEQRLRDQVSAHAAFRRRLCERLRQDPDIEVIVDEDIPPGLPWRDLLFDRIADCRAAVVLVNEQALLHSPWVDTEVKVLGYRAHHEKKEEFCLIVVPIEGVKGEDIINYRAWAPIALGEFEMLPRRSLDVNDWTESEGVISQIVETLKRLPEIDGDGSKSGWLVDRLCALLQEQRENLQGLGKSLGVETKALEENARVLRRRIAHQLYREGPLAVLKLLANPHCTLKRRDLEGILDILKTYWIDLSASPGILCCAKSDEHRVIALNGREVAYTPSAYVRQVCSEQYAWPVIPLISTYDVVGQIRETLLEDERFSAALEAEIGNPKYASDEMIIGGLNSVLSGPRAVPVFVAFMQQKGGIVSDLVKEISAAFPTIRVIVCTGTEGTPAFVPDAYMLTPELCLDAESKTKGEFSDASTHFPKGK